MFLGETLYSHSASVSTQVYKQVLGKFNVLGVPCSGLASHPGGISNTPSRFISYRNWNKCWPNGPLGTYADFTSTSELPFASFSERVLVLNDSHERHLIFL